jgi:ankyrin repeat protein
MALSKGKALWWCVFVAVASAWAIHYYTVARLTKLTLLMSAAKAGHVAGVERELRAGADPNRVWNEGGFRVHGTARTGVTALLFALESAGPGTSSRAPVVRLLLEAGASPCVRDNQHNSALLMAVSRRDTEAARALREFDRSGCLRAEAAAAVLEAYRLLSFNPQNPDTWKLVEYLIDEVVQPGEADHPGLLVAATDPAAEAALMRLLDRGVKADGESLMLASIYGKAELIPVLIEHGADINRPFDGFLAEDKGPPLVRAAANPNARGMAALLDAGADVNAVDAAGRTALSRLVCESSCTTRPSRLCEAQIESLRLLLAHGAQRAGTSRFGNKLEECLADRPLDPYLADIATLLGVAAPAGSQ